MIFCIYLWKYGPFRIFKRVILVTCSEIFVLWSIMHICLVVLKGNFTEQKIRIMDISSFCLFWISTRHFAMLWSIALGEKYAALIHLWCSASFIHGLSTHAISQGLQTYNVHPRPGKGWNHKPTLSPNPPASNQPEQSIALAIGGYHRIFCTHVMGYPSPVRSQFEFMKTQIFHYH